MEAWNRRDLDGILELADPEIEYVNAPGAVEPGTRRGREAVGTVFQNQWENLGDATQEIDRVHDRGDRQICEARVGRQMPGSDARIENKVLMAWSFRDGKIIRMEILGGGSDFDTALEAAGLQDG